MTHFTYTDYKEFIIHLIKNGPGRGEYSRMAHHLQVSNVLISQIFKGHKDLNSEQAIRLCEYFGFTELETKYFMNCMSFNKAGNQELKKYFRKEMNEIEARSKLISNRVTSQRVLNEQEKSIYFSDWIYSAIHLSCSLPNIKSANDAAHYFGIPLSKAESVIKYLIECNLVQKTSGELQTGTTYIHLEKDSPLLTQHHRNWRLLSSLKSSHVSNTEVMYTAPMVISEELALALQQKILKFIESVVKSTHGCKDEVLWNFNIDFLKINPHDVG